MNEIDKYLQGLTNVWYEDAPQSTSLAYDKYEVIELLKKVIDEQYEKGWKDCERISLNEIKKYQ